MKKLFFILISILILGSVSQAQVPVSGGYGWNYESRTTTTVKDSMTWANAALTLYYQIYPRIGAYLNTEPPKTSRLWAGKGALNKRTKLLLVGTTQLDSCVRYLPIKADSLQMGQWIRFIADDGTNKDTSQTIQIGGYSKFQIYYYFDDVSTNLLREYLKLECQ